MITLFKYEVTTNKETTMKQVTVTITKTVTFVAEDEKIKDLIVEVGNGMCIDPDLYCRNYIEIVEVSDAIYGEELIITEV